MTVVRAIALVLLAAGVAEAQSQPAQPAASARHPWELGVGSPITGGIKLGSQTAALLAPDGSPFTLFRTDSRIAPGFGVEVNLAYRLTDKLTGEATGSWNRMRFRTKVSADAEGAEDLTAELSASRFTVEGSALWLLTRRNKMEFFVRGGGGWMRELAEGNALFENGGVGTAGVGMKYLLKERASGRIRRLSLRLEGRALVRSGGLTVGSRSTKMTPAFAASLTFGL